MELKIYLKEKRELVETFLASYLGAGFAPPVLHEAMNYSVSAGGKRVRPVLCIAAYEACGGKAEDVVPQASAIELIHTYSLIHDDLPAMDNDDLRRGKPTNHKVFGEGMAILAGDGLLTEAFSLLGDPRYRHKATSDAQIVKIIFELAVASGAHGMVGGQAQDLLSENAEPDPETLSFIHRHKTAALLSVSVRMGAILAGADTAKMKGLNSYGENIGLAFQVVDDILDIEGETEVIGKPKGSDEKKKKMTYPRLYGIDESRKKAKELIDSAIGALTEFDQKAEPLRAIARYLYERKN
jgi:geranylgeranyl diphosphate synthase, type II